MHNQRIERLWLDLWKWVIRVYYELFHQTEAENILDPANDVHLWCLHYVFLPRLQAHFDHFVEMWNSHGVRTERFRTPIRLFIMGELPPLGVLRIQMLMLLAATSRSS